MTSRRSEGTAGIRGEVCALHGSRLVAVGHARDLRRRPGSSPSVAAAASFAAFALLLGRRRSRWLQVVLAGAATRLALGVHWVTDVVAGLVVGWGWFALCTLAVGGPAPHLGRPLETARPAQQRRRASGAGRFGSLGFGNSPGMASGATVCSVR